MSYGWETYENVLKDAVDYAYNKEVFLCACAHNHNTSIKRYPAAFDNVVAVAATNQRDERCDEDDWGEGYGSNYGDWVDIAAPGNRIFTTRHDFEYTDLAWGTSMSTPFVAGVAALILAANPSLNPKEVKSLICENVDPYVSEVYIGTGRINADKAVTAAISLIADLYCEGTIEWNDVSAGSTQSGSFEIENVGGSASLLDWSISKYPSWGEWTLDPISGNDLEYETPFTINVTVVAPPEKNKVFNGEIKIKNKDNSIDTCTIDVKLSTPKNKPFNTNLPFQRVLENHPWMVPILRQLLG